MELTRNTRIIDLTLGEFEDWMKARGFQPSRPSDNATNKHWVYGVAGVMSLFNWSESTALRKIHGVLAPACVWTGPRKVQVDADLAVKLLNQSNL